MKYVNWADIIKNWKEAGYSFDILSPYSTSYDKNGVGLYDYACDTNDATLIKNLEMFDDITKYLIVTRKAKQIQCEAEQKAKQKQEKREQIALRHQEYLDEQKRSEEQRLLYVQEQKKLREEQRIKERKERHARNKERQWRQEEERQQMHRLLAAKIIHALSVFKIPVELNLQDALNDMPLFQTKLLEYSEQIKNAWLHLLETDFISASEKESVLMNCYILTQQQIDLHKRNIINVWATSKGIQLDEQQLSAVQHIQGNILLKARAGSGKTNTLVARALFLIDFCRINPHKILLLAFNKNAKETIKERLKKFLPEKMLPKIETFHSLAYSIVTPSENIIGDKDGQKTFSQAIQQIIKELLNGDTFSTTVKDFVFNQQRTDWESFAEYKDYNNQYSNAIETFDGKIVKSFGEKLISNFLFEYGLDYRYEFCFAWGSGIYHPDFTIFLPNKTKIVIEYFGMAGDPAYDKITADKKNYWKNRTDAVLIDLYPDDIGNDWQHFYSVLKSKLTTIGVPLTKRSEDEIWDIIKSADMSSLAPLNTFIQNINKFITVARQKNMTVSDLEHLEAGYEYRFSAEKSFLSLVKIIYQKYLDKLVAEYKDDFNGLLWRATDILKQGAPCFNADYLKHIEFCFIDEFQDFSEMFYELIKAMRSQTNRLNLFCVGDDWQAINGFAGSESKYFSGFSSLFDKATELELITNYRSAQKIVDVGNKFMAASGVSGTPAVARRDAKDGVLILCEVPMGKIKTNDREWFAKCITEELLLKFPGEIACLSRTNYVPWPTQNGRLDFFSQYIRNISDLSPKFSTVHSFKGMEENTIVILDGKYNRYPLLNPNWVFTRILGNSIEAIVREEKNLFYVALTRAVQNLIIIVPAEDQEELTISPFVKLISNHLKHIKIRPSDFGIQIILSGKTFYIKDNLKEYGFKWQRNTQSWIKTFADNSFESIKQEGWTNLISKQINIDIVCSELYSKEKNDFLHYLQERHHSTA